MVGLRFEEIATGAAAHGPHVPADVLIPESKDIHATWRRHADMHRFVAADSALST